jgi:hypothetical protein
MVMLPLALLLSAVLPQVAAPVLVSVSTGGLPDREREAVVAHLVAEVQSTGATPTPLPSGVVSTACVADAACARTLFASGAAVRLVVVDVLRAGSRASISARVVDRDGRTIAAHTGVLPMAKILASREPLLPGTLLDVLTVTGTPTPAVVPTPTLVAPPVAEPTALPPSTPAPTSDSTSSTTPTSTSSSTPTSTSPATGVSPDPGAGVILGVSATAVGALFLLGGAAAALAQNAVRLDSGAEGEARAATALSIPLALGVSTLGAVGVGVGVVMLSGDDSAAAVGG